MQNPRESRFIVLNENWCAWYGDVVLCVDGLLRFNLCFLLVSPGHRLLYHMDEFAV